MLLQDDLLNTLQGSVDLVNLIFWLVIILLIVVVALYPIKKAFDIRASKRAGDRGKRRLK